MNRDFQIDRRDILRASAGIAALSVLPAVASDAASVGGRVPKAAGEKVTIEQRGAVVLIGIYLPEVANRIDPDTYLALGAIARSSSKRRVRGER